ncbi:MAG TPA: hypothetical protein VME66_02875 [Candidatus Acidoferrales bacterium]|nr:hypothetical protein [Candidatus Acidoferrales bacterium]
MAVAAALSLALTSPGNRAEAQLAPTPSPLEYCPFHVAEVEGLDRAPEVSQNYAIALESEFAQGLASGTLVFYVGNDRYEASFASATASVRGDSPNEATPVVVQFPAAVHIDAAYVGALQLPVAGYCDPANVWLPADPGDTTAVIPFDRDRFRKAAAHLPAIDASLVQREPAPSCDHPDVAAHPVETVSGAAALAQVLQKSAAPPSVVIAIALTAGDSIAASKVLASTASHAAQERALHDALSESYVTERFRCEPVASTYIYTALH